MTVRRRVVVSGRVQGVFFRDSCRRIATERGVAGSARNLPDGRVEVILEGDGSAVDEVVRWAHEGTPYADVTGVEVIDEEVEGLRDFSIL